MGKEPATKSRVQNVGVLVTIQQVTHTKTVGVKGESALVALKVLTQLVCTVSAFPALPLEK